MNYTLDTEKLAKFITSTLQRKHDSHQKNASKKLNDEQVKALYNSYYNAIDFGRNAVPLIKEPTTNRGSSGNKIESKKYPGVYSRPNFYLAHGKKTYKVNFLNHIGQYGYVNGFLGLLDPGAGGIIGYEETKHLFKACESKFLEFQAAFVAECERIEANVDEYAAEYVKKNAGFDGPRIQGLLGKELVESGLKDEDPALILGFLQITARAAYDLKNLMRFVGKYKGAINFLDVEGVQNSINLAKVEEIQKS